MANEKMDAYAYLSLLTAILRLGIALLLIFVANADTLIVYAVLMLLVSVVVFLCYFVYSLRKFDECTLSLSAPRDVLRSLLGFSGSDIVGNLCCTMNYQGTLVVLNRFGGTVLNAAGGITMQVNGAMTQFGMSIVSAFRPQIVKQYAAGDFDYMNRLMANCARFSVMLMAIFSVPAIVEMKTLLGLWLGQVPEYAVEFCRIALITSFTEMVRLALNCGVHATGRILWFSLITGGLYLVELPFMYWLIFATEAPWIVYGSHLFLGFLLVAITIIILKNLMGQFRSRRFVWRGIFVPALIVIVAAIAATIPSYYFEPSFQRLILSGLSSALSIAVLGLTFGIDAQSRRDLVAKLKGKFGR
jgi:Na+-driven multidrug efflux pump